MLTFFKNISFLLLSVSLFSACQESSYTSSQTHGSSLKGKVASGYIQETSVCLDLDYSNNCNDDEPQTGTNENGEYNFSDLEVSETSIVPVLASSSQKSLRTIVEISPDEDLEDVVISPLTDLTATYFLSSYEKNSLDLLDAKNIVVSSFNITEYQLEEDPINSRTLFIATQKLYYTTMLIESAVNKHIATPNAFTGTTKIETIIKEELLQNNAIISTILVSLETAFSIVIPENEKVFIQMQIQELQEKLNTIAFNNTIEELQSIQEYISKQLIIANERLKVIDGDYEVEIVSLDLFSKLI
ncbi:MAG: hypothetical protein U9N39_01200 [Campylobacterota bacterium]|nr:hypothetical protein [Campylobacterota bacterium]